MPISIAGGIERCVHCLYLLIEPALPRIERSDPDVPERLSDLPETDEEEREGMGDFAEWTLNDRPRMIVLAFLIFPAADPLPTPKSSNIASILLDSLAP